MIKPVSFILLVFMFSIFVKAQNATDLYDQAMSLYDNQQYMKSQGVINELIILAKREKWQGENWVGILMLKCRIEEKIDPEGAIIDCLNVLEVCKTSLGNAHSCYGICSNDLALLYKSLGEYNKALPLALEALQSTGKNLGKDHPNYLIMVKNVAVLYDNMGNYAKALQLYLEALENAKINLGKNDPEYVDSLISLVELYSKIDENSKALEMCVEHLEYIEMYLGRNNLEYRNILLKLAELYYKLDEYDKALSLYWEALENTERNIGKDDPEYIARLKNLATFYYNLNEYDKALPLYIETLENTEKTLGKGHSEYGASLNDLAVLYEKMGNYAKALQLYLQVLENTKKNLGKDHPHYTTCLNNLAGLYSNMDDYAKALPLYKEALENAKKNGKEHRDYSIQLNDLAVLYHRMGEYDKALPLYLEAIDIDKKEIGNDNSSYSTTLSNLASLYQDMGHLDKALNLHLEAFENTMKNLDQNPPIYDNCLNSLASVYYEMGEHSKALSLFLEAHENVKKRKGRGHSDYGISLTNLAVIYSDEGEFTKALDLFIEALENFEKSLGKDHIKYIVVLNKLASLYAEMGEYNKALAFYQRGTESYKRFLTNNIFGLSEDSKTSIISQGFHYIKASQNLMFQLPELTPNIVTQAWEDILFYKGLALKSGNLLKQKLQSSNDTLIVSILVELDLYQNLVNKELAKPIDKQSLSLSKYQTKAKDAELQLLAKSKEFTQLKEGLSASYEDIIKHLKRGEAAIEFTHFDFHRREWTDTNYYAAYIIRPELSQPEMVVLFTEKELLDRVSVSTSNAKNINTNYLKRGATPINNELSTINIYDLIWEKLTPYLTDVSTIYLSPSGYLSKVSFAAMQDSTGRYVGEKYQINYMMSLTDLLFEKTATTPTSFLLAGGINYEYDATKKEAIKDTFDLSAIPRRGLRGDTWTYLEGTKSESQKIESLLKAAKKETIYFSEENATEKNIKLALTQSPSVFHIATHGFYIPMETKHEEKDFQKENVYKVNEDPMYRSGLLLAGGNYAWENAGNPYEEEDGILLAKEISTMNLSNTQLVVLSACETGLGDLNGSEGVMGLQRALKMAGVQYQITTLWQVPDAETVEFMELFYTDWISGNTIEKSFNKAQLNMSKKYADDPYKWGAFVLYQ